MHRDAAIHEAGHTIVAVALGASVPAAWARPDAFRGGTLVAWPGVQPGQLAAWPLHLLRLDLAVSVAGALAERMVTGHDWPARISEDVASRDPEGWTATCDQADALRLAREILRRRRHRPAPDLCLLVGEVAQAERLAQVVLDAQWEDVQLLAEALAECERLEGAQVAYLLGAG